MSDTTYPYAKYVPQAHSVIYQEAAYRAHIKKLRAIFEEIGYSNELADAAAEKVAVLRCPTQDELLAAREIVKANAAQEYK